jgi:hypothetical protein
LPPSLDGPARCSASARKREGGEWVKLPTPVQVAPTPTPYPSRKGRGERRPVIEKGSALGNSLTGEQPQ